MKKRITAIIALFAFIMTLIPVSSAYAAETKGLCNGTVELDTDPEGGYEGEYVLIYNPSTYYYRSYSTGNMDGLIETGIEPYSNVHPQKGVESDKPYKMDVDAIVDSMSSVDVKAAVDMRDGASYEVGDVRTFVIYNYSPGAYSVKFKCVAKGEHCYVWTPSSEDPYYNDNFYPLDEIDEAFPQMVCDEFEAKFPLMKSSFGDHMNGANGDGRINLMYYNIDDGFEPGVNEGYVAGYFSKNDFTTNGLPMIHVDTYPGVHYVSLSGVESNDVTDTYSTFCHEYQHLINYSITGGMDTWLNEAMSAAAEEICYPGSSLVSRIQSWERYYYRNNNDWLTPPQEFEYFAPYELHNGYSMYTWSNSLSYVLPLYSQVCLFSQYLYSRFGNGIFKIISQNYNGAGSSPTAIATATGMDTSELVKNFRIAVTANDPVSFDGLYGFRLQEGYDPAEYHDVENIYDLLGPVVFTGSSCDIKGGGSITVKPVGGVYNPPADASSSLVYVGITRKMPHVAVQLDGIALKPAEVLAYIGRPVKIEVVATPINANDFDTVWVSSDDSIATVESHERYATISGISEGQAIITCTATDRTTGASYSAQSTVNVKHYPTRDEALNVENGTLEFSDGDTQYPWIVNTNYQNRLCANSTNQNNGGGYYATKSSIETTISMEAGETLSFDWAVSSESYDKFKFYVNNQLIATISGSQNFETYTYEASTAGSFNFKWSYEKDSTLNNGTDTAYLDDVVYSGDPGLDVPTTHTVRFIDGVDSHVIAEVTVEHGADAQAPDAPQHDLYVFREWDGDYTNVVEDIDVIALYALLGDANSDGVVDMLDALAVLRYSMSNDNTGIDMLAADITLDGDVNTLDALLIIRYAMGILG